MARRKHQNTQQRLSYDSLESRQLLAGDWSASVPSSQFWKLTDWETVQTIPGDNYIRAERFSLYQLEMNDIRPHLAQAPLEFTPSARTPMVFAVPTPEGSLTRFEVVEAPIMHPALAAEFPDIRTYRGQGIDDPAATIRLDVTLQGFHAQVLSPHGSYYVDPYYHLNDSVYMSYYKQDLVAKNANPHGDQDCGCCGCGCAACQLFVMDDPVSYHVRPLFSMSAPPSGDQLFVYRLAVGATGEYTQFHGGTVAAGMSAIVTAVNRVTGVYEIDLTIRMELVPNNSSVVYTNPNTDPYTNNNGSTMLNQNQSVMDSIIGSANYDIGHVFSTGGGGVAFLGVVGVNGHKAKGVTGQNQPIGDPFYIDYVAHEMGHQFGANHSFNGTGGSCTSGSRNAATAYEPGSGSTIMAYAGICGNNNLQINSDPYFHFISVEEIRNYVSSGPGFTSAQKFNTGNSIPNVNAGPNYVIPDQTPFFLTAVGSDADAGDVLTYAWEQRDLGPQQTVGAADNGSSPLFRSWNPTTNPVRYFPRLSDVLNNTTVIGEKYAQTNRNLNFRVTVRDNRSGGGGVNSDDMTVTVVDSGTGFRITSQNTATNWQGNSSQVVTWNVSGTAGGAINTPFVDIL
ncbi:MAG TPA: M12 family metallo-peptidase, partial [Pirellulaceae bacterium]|nr:M12 family metallo-peptidase [Pirellulaceae bacterium]